MRRDIFVGITLGVVIGFFIEEKIKKENKTMDNICAAIPVAANRYLEQVSKKELEDRIKAMTPDELEIVVKHIPVDICLRRVQAEFDRLNSFTQTLQASFEVLGMPVNIGEKVSG